MKISVITCHCPHNNGAVLQAVGLQRWLLGRGVDAEVIDYRPDYLVRCQRLGYVGDARLGRNPLLRLLYLAASFPFRLRRRSVFARFLRRELRCTPECYPDCDSLRRNPPRADRYICGSDQIWNTDLPNGRDEAYCLSFVADPARRNAYAASVAVRLARESAGAAFLLPRLALFHSLSVREDTTAALLSSWLGRPVRQTVDPVFLLRAEEWDEIAARDAHPLPAQPYVLTYPMGDGRSVFPVAEAVARAAGLPLYAVSFSLRRHPAVDRQFRASSPGRFLQLVRGASYVVSNSFHGTAFALIYRRDFWACGIPGTGDRIGSLLRLAGLENRFVAPEADLSPAELLRPVDYGCAVPRLQRAVASSEEFLERIIHG